MLTKSKIQLIQESIKVANDFKTGLENIMEKYTIEDSIFMYNIKEAQRYNLLIINDQGVKKYNIKEKDVEDIYNI